MFLSDENRTVSIRYRKSSNWTLTIPVVMEMKAEICTYCSVSEDGSAGEMTIAKS